MWKGYVGGTDNGRVSIVDRAYVGSTDNERVSIVE